MLVRLQSSAPCFLTGLQKKLGDTHRAELLYAGEGGAEQKETKQKEKKRKQQEIEFS